MSDDERRVLRAWDDAMEGVFAQAFSNGLFDAWGRRIPCTALNDAWSRTKTILAPRGVEGAAGSEAT